MNLDSIIIIAEGFFSGGSMVFYLWLTWPFIKATVWPMRIEYSRQKKLIRQNKRKRNDSYVDPIEELRKQF